MTDLSPFCVLLVTCALPLACGGHLDADASSTSSHAGAGGDIPNAGAGGSLNTAGSNTGGASDIEGGSGGRGGRDGDGVVFVEDFEDGDTNGWFRSCASIDALHEAAAGATSFGAQYIEALAQGCDEGFAVLAVPSLTPTRVEWWMRLNSEGQSF